MWTLLVGLSLAAQADLYPGIADPRAFVAERYALYEWGAGAIPALDPIATARLRVHLEGQEVAMGGQELIDHDWWVAGREGEEPRIGAVALAETGTGEQREVIARLRNHGRAAVLHFLFRREAGAWRLDDVIGDSGGRRWTLIGLLARRPTAPPNP